MKYKQQDLKLSVINFDNFLKNNDSNFKKKRHGKLLPNNIRCLMVGPSNCGKTNTLFNLLFDPYGLCFSNIYVFSKSLYQPKYQFLKEILSDIEGIEYYSFKHNENIIAPEETNPNSIMIFDDVICEKQNNIVKYFTMGRHNDLDVFYLCQTYSRIPKQLVRDNTNF